MSGDNVASFRSHIKSRPWSKVRNAAIPAIPAGDKEEGISFSFF
jgi:hypothetical protein